MNEICLRMYFFDTEEIAKKAKLCITNEKNKKFFFILLKIRNFCIFVELLNII